MKNKDLWTAVIVIAILYFIFYLVGIGCPIRFFTGIPCLGCGTTRAILAALRLDFKAAFRFHPLFWRPAPTVIVFLCKNRIPRKTYKIIIGAIIALYVVVYIFRLLSGNDPIVHMAPREGFIYKIFTYI